MRTIKSKWGAGVVLVVVRGAGGVGEASRDRLPRKGHPASHLDRVSDSHPLPLVGRARCHCRVGGRELSSPLSGDPFPTSAPDPFPALAPDPPSAPHPTRYFCKESPLLEILNRVMRSKTKNDMVEEETLNLKVSCLFCFVSSS